MFGNSFSLQIDEGVGSIKSPIGSLFSFIFVAILCSYAYEKAAILINRDGQSISMFETEMHYDDSFNFTHKQGLRIAAAVSGFDNIREW